MVSDHDFSLLDARVEALDEEQQLVAAKIAALERVCDELLTFAKSGVDGESERLRAAEQALAEALTIHLR